MSISAGFKLRRSRGGGRRAAPAVKTLSYDHRFSGSVPGGYLPRINRGGRRWTLATGTAGIAGASIRILGIDPGSQATGFGIIDWQDGHARYVASGAIRTKGAAFPPRLRQIYDGVQELVRQYQPVEVAIERVFMHRNADSALKLGQARGAAICGVFTIAAELYEYAPREVKLAIVGQGGAQK